MTTTAPRAQTLPAKEPLTVAAGPYGHPFHPILVTVPIGAWICSLIFDIASQVNSKGAPSLVDASYWLIAIGLIGAVTAALFGLMDLIKIPRGTPALRVGLTHMLLNLTVVGLFIGNLAWRHSSYYESAQVSGGKIALSAVAIGLLGMSGWLGGKLSYRYGVRVADEGTQAEGYRSAA